MRVDEGLNTLADFRHRRLYRAKNGQPGMGRGRTGRSAEDMYINVPVGTMVYDEQADELIGDLTRKSAVLLAAKGGFHGLGNTRFKSSTNRAPRKITKGSAGEHRDLKLELRVLADVGLLGLPNVGKSTLIRAVSSARPKVANYPFTTMYPGLGVVKIEDRNDFVIADIPGLISGAAKGAGLGIRFLKHLSRVHLLLHLVDASTDDNIARMLEDIRTIEEELAAYSYSLLNRKRWLVLNKCDVWPDETAASMLDSLKKAVTGVERMFAISAITGAGCRELMCGISEWMSQSAQKRCVL